MAMTAEEQEEIKIISRAEALSMGLKKYFTGKPCKYGHSEHRLVCDGGCYACKLRDAKAWKKRNKSHISEYRKKNYLENKQERNSYRKKKYQENKVIELANCKKWRARNLARAMKICQDYKKKNQEKIRQSYKEWRRNHPIEVMTRNRNRKKNVIANGGSHTAKEIATLLIDQKHQCANPKCNKSIIDAYHADHVMPIKLGGKNNIGNIQLLCPRCNQTKGSLHPDVWKKKIGIS